MEQQEPKDIVLINLSVENTSLKIEIEELKMLIHDMKSDNELMNNFSKEEVESNNKEV